MARENEIILIGGVYSYSEIQPPKAFVVEGFGTYMVSFGMEVRRNNGRVDYPVVKKFGLTEAEARALFEALREGNYFLVKGMISGYNSTKEIVCPDCGELNKVSTRTTEVIATEIVPLQKEFPISDIIESANRAHIIGRVCSTPANRTTTKGVCLTQYQLAVPRKIHVAEDDHRTDFMWVKSLGEHGEKDALYVEKGAIVYVNGSIQTRKVDKHCTCTKCSRDIAYREVVSEVVPNDVEYLKQSEFVNSFQVEEEAVNIKTRD